MAFDYDSPAELFIPKRKGIGGARSPITYRRFATAGEAIRFAVEEFPAARTNGAWMQVGEERFNSDEIYRLYESSGFSRRPNISRQDDRAR
jgi:hypothetical protein